MRNYQCIARSMSAKSREINEFYQGILDYTTYQGKDAVAMHKCRYETELCNVQYFLKKYDAQPRDYTTPMEYILYLEARVAITICIDNINKLIDLLNHRHKRF